MINYKNIAVFLCLIAAFLSPGSLLATDETKEDFTYHYIDKDQKISDYKKQRLQDAYNHWSSIYGFKIDRGIDVYVYDRMVSVPDIKAGAGQYVIIDTYVPPLKEEAKLSDEVYYRNLDVQVGQIFMAIRKGIIDRLGSNSTAPWNGDQANVEFEWWENGLLSFSKSTGYPLPNYSEIYLRGHVSSVDNSLKNQILNINGLSDKASYPVKHISKNSVANAFWNYLYTNTDGNQFAGIVSSVTAGGKSLETALKQTTGESLSNTWKQFKATFSTRDEEPHVAEKYILGMRFNEILGYKVSTTGKMIAVHKRNVPERESVVVREIGTNVYKHGIHHRKFLGFAWSTQEDYLYYQILDSKNQTESLSYDVTKNKTKDFKELSSVNNFAVGTNDVVFGTDEKKNLCILRPAQKVITCVTENKPPDLEFFSPKPSPVQSVFNFATIKDGVVTNYVLDPDTDAFAQIFAELDLVVEPEWTPTGDCLYFNGFKDGQMDLYRFCIGNLALEKSNIYFGDIDHPNTDIEGEWLYFVRHLENKDMLDRFPLAELSWVPVSGKASAVTGRYMPGLSGQENIKEENTLLKWSSNYSAYPYAKPVPYGAKVGAGFTVDYKPVGNARGFVAWDSKLNGVDVDVKFSRERLLWQPTVEYSLSNIYVRGSNSFWRRHLIDAGISWHPHPRADLTFGGRFEHIFFKDMPIDSDNFGGPYIKFDLSTKPDYLSPKPAPGIRWLTDAYMALDWNGDRYHPVIESDFNYTINPAGFIYDAGVHFRYTTNIDPAYRFYSFGGDLGYLTERPYPGVIGLPYQQFIGQHVISINQEVWIPVASVNQGINSTYLNLGDIYLVGLFDIGWLDLTRSGSHYEGIGGELRLLTKIFPYLPLRLAAGYHHSFNGFGGKFYWGVRSQF